MVSIFNRYDLLDYFNRTDVIPFILLEQYVFGYLISPYFYFDGETSN